MWRTCRPAVNETGPGQATMHDVGSSTIYAATIMD
jgi:hypothetical protein